MNEHQDGPTGPSPADMDEIIRSAVDDQHACPELSASVWRCWSAAFPAGSGAGACVEPLSRGRPNSRSSRRDGSERGRDWFGGVLLLRTRCPHLV